MKAISIFILLVSLVACRSTQKTIQNDYIVTDKHWTLIELNGEPIDMSHDAHLILHSEENRITGNGGCNTFSGSYWLEEDSKIIFSQLLSTKKFCMDVDYETRFMNAIQETDNFSLNGDTLIFYDDVMHAVASFVYSTLN